MSIRPRIESIEGILVIGTKQGGFITAVVAIVASSCIPID